MTELSLPAIGKWVFAFILAQWLAIEEPSRVAITTLMLLMGIDYVTGLLAGYITKELSSRAGARGLAIKGLVLSLILTAHILERLFGTEYHLELVGAMGYCVNEIISIVENCARSGVPIWTPLVKALLTIKHLVPKAATPDQLRALADDLDAAEEPAKPGI